MGRFDANAYLGLPYRAGGRDRAGLDCWGLVRMVYAEQFGIDLPGHDEASLFDDAEQADYIAAHREGWREVQTPETGDLVLLRADGEEHHIGIVSAPGWFLHAHNGGASVQERYTAAKWLRRVVGFYRYTPRRTGVVLSGRPHPLKTLRVDAHAVPGTTLAEAIMAQCAGLHPDLVHHGVAFVNGRRVPFESWAEIVLSDGDRIEFRMLPGKDTRSILMVVVAVAAAWATSGASSAWVEAGYGTAGSFSAGAVGALAGMAMTVAGQALVNRIAPIQTQTLGDAATTAPKPQYLLAGGQNQATPYAAWPVVLGEHRFTPPLAAKSYFSTNGTDRFLHLLLVWGYGPLDVSDLKIGDTALTAYENVEIAHLPGYAGEYSGGVLNRANPEVARFLDLYGGATAQQSPQVLLDTNWVARTTEQKNLTRAEVVLSFPQGLFTYANDGSRQYQDVAVESRYRRLGYWNDSGVWVPGVEAWQNGVTHLDGKPATLIQSTVTSRTVVYLDGANGLYIKSSPGSDWPYVPASATLIYRIQDHTLVETLNTDKFTGLALTISSRSVTNVWGDPQTYWYAAIGPGDHSSYLIFGNSSADPFDYTIGFDFSARPGQYEIAWRRMTADSTSTSTADSLYWLALTEFAQGEAVIAPPAPMAMSVVRIQSSDQLNGTLEGVTATVRSRQRVWNGSAWGMPAEGDARNNPASLIRHVLQHPGNAKRVADDGIDLPSLQHFSEFCAAKGFIYENVLTAQRPVRDVVREIAAAGRASISQPDGRWAVVIDEEKPTIAQHFTPHNSWGFKGTILLPEIPHALKASFLNRDKDYQPDEYITYADGYSATNATLFESISLPGTTRAGTSAAPGPVFKLSRFHFEQLALRRENYEFYADQEAIVCTRGDRIECGHHVPQWGLGTGRIKSVTLDGSNRVTAVVIDELVPMVAGKNYALRWRTATNQSNWGSVTTVQGLGNTLSFLVPVASNPPAAGDLVMFGEVGLMTASLIVNDIESLPNLQARITAYDYAPALFDNEANPFGAWESKITSAPPNLRLSILQQPIIDTLAGDEAALTRSGSGFQANLLVKWRTDVARRSAADATQEAVLDEVARIEVQYRLTASSLVPWSSIGRVDIKSGSVYIGPLNEGHNYDLRLRFVGASGRFGPWLTQTGIPVTGKGNPPAAITGLRYSFAATSLTASSVTLDWDDSPEMDVVDYAVSRPGRTVYVSASTFTELAEWTGDRSYTVRARDSVGNLGAAVTITIGKQPPGVPTGLRADVVDNNVLIYWAMPAMTSLPLSGIELRRGASWAAGEIIGRKSGAFTSVFELVSGVKTYWLAAVDTDGQLGTPVSLSVTVAQPPDYLLKVDQDSTFSGTLTNALLEAGSLIMPVNTTETIAQHFDSHGWASPQDQINAGYPIFIQPTPNTAQYEEVIDYGAVLNATRVTVTPTIQTLAGAPVVTTLLSYRVNSGDAWTDCAGTQAYISSFRFLRVRISVAAAGGDDLLRVSKVNVKLDSKLKTITGQVACNAADAGGTTVYLTSDRTAGGTGEFLDVDAIQVTAQGTTAVTALYDFVDAPNPTQMKVLLFNSTTGARVSGTASYSVRGF